MTKAGSPLTLPERYRPLLGGLTGSRCLAQRGLLLASVYVLQRIPSHPLHVSALLRWPLSSVGTAGVQNSGGGRGTGVRCVGGVSDAGPGPPSVALELGPASQGDTGPHFFTSNLIPIYLPILILPRYQNCVCSHVVILNRRPVSVLEPDTDGVSAQPHPWLRLVFLT